MARYDYARGYRGVPPGYAGWYPGAFWAGAPMYGWGAWGWPGYAGPVGYGVPPYDLAPRRRPPDESPTYGRAGDEAARRWARRHGYDVGYPIDPTRGPRRRSRYDAEWR